MAPVNARQIAQSAVMPNKGGQHSSSHSQEGAQSQDIDIEAVVQKQKDQNKLNRQRRERAIEAARIRCIDEVERKLIRCREQHEAKLVQRRRPTVRRLHALLRRKRELEAKLNKVYAQMDQAFESTAEQYRVAIQGRIDDLSEDEAS